MRAKKSLKIFGSDLQLLIFATRFETNASQKQAEKRKKDRCRERKLQVTKRISSLQMVNRQGVKSANKK